MNSTDHKTKRLLQLLPFALFFIAGTFFLYYFTNYLFFYQEKSTLFLVSFSYLYDHLNQPGGFLTYLGELQTTFYYYPIIGAVLLTIEICGIIFFIQRIGEKLSGRSFYVIPFLIGAALFYLQSNYQYQAFVNLGILIQLGFIYCTINTSKREYLWVSVFLTPVIYFLFGSFSVIFISAFFIYLIQKKSWLKMGITSIICCLFFFIGKAFLFFQITETLIQYPFLVKDIGGQVKLFGVIVGMLVLLLILLRIDLKKVFSLSIKNIKLVELTPFVIIGVLAFLLSSRIDKKNSHYFHAEKLFYQQKYDELISFNTQFPSTNILTAFLNNVALSETGNLTDNFFAFPQTSDGGTLFLKWEIISEVLKRGGYFYYSLGMVNEAQRWAYEYVVMNGNTPEALKMMIKTDLIKGKYAIAEKYISILEKSIFYRKDAKAFRKLLYKDDAINKHLELGTKQKNDTKADFFVQAENPAANLNYIIEADSTNIPAIEYKLAWLMLQKDMQGVVDMLPIMEKAGYSRIPKNVEEVVVSYKLMKVGELPKLQRLKVSTQCEQRFDKFYRIFQQNRNNKQQAQRALASEFSDTYWYYVFFR